MVFRRTPFTAVLTCLMAISFPHESDAQKRGKKKKSPTPPPINQDAKNLAKAIPLYKRETSRKDAEEQMRQIIHLLAQTNRDSVSSNGALLKKAMDFRKDIGAYQKTTTIGAILKAWDIAHDYGAMTNHHLSDIATSGRYQGERLVFENVVPPKLVPESQGYLGNLRLVPASQVRKDGTPVATRDKAFAATIQQVLYESKTHAASLLPMGISAEEYEKRWWKEVQATGEAYKHPPAIDLEGQRLGSPSAINDFRYTLRVEATNLSRHPTEVEINTTIVGYTENDNRIYEMRRDRRTIKLRRSEVHVFEIKTPNINTFKEALKKFDPGKSTKVIYRGFTINAKFNDEVLTTTGSDGRMARVATGEYAAPSMINKVSRMGSMQPRPASKRRYNLLRFSSAKALTTGKGGTVIDAGATDAIALMADETRLWRIDSYGALWLHESHSFTAKAVPLGRTFAGTEIHSISCDNTNYYIHLKEAAGDYQANDVITFTSVDDLISGYYGTVVNQPIPGSTRLMSDGKSHYKIYYGINNNLLLHSRNFNQLLINGEIGTTGKLAFGKNHSATFSDGKHYYIMLPANALK